ncbi:MAG: L-serine ammonia-lyase, iron-sulfur-dependent, subunit beta [Candidatus Odinarchaeota archaeon]
MKKLATYVARAISQKVPLSTLMIDREIKRQQVSEEAIIRGMARTYSVMREAALTRIYEPYVADITGDIVSQYGNYLDSCKTAEKTTLTGSFTSEIMLRALTAAKNNSMMKVIVAAPTAGSSGILPGVLTAMEDHKAIPREKIIRSLFTAGLVSMVIADSVTLAGAAGGCMAECGSAAAMAAASVVELMAESANSRDIPGLPEQCGNAAALALKQHLGLACDPIAGVVECPCVKRNAMSAIVALSAAEMSVAGVYSVVPFDEVLAAMKDIAGKMDASLRETSLGGLAMTPTGKWWQGRLR